MIHHPFGLRTEVCPQFVLVPPLVSTLFQHSGHRHRNRDLYRRCGNGRMPQTIPLLTTVDQSVRSIRVHRPPARPMSVVGGVVDVAIAVDLSWEISFLNSVKRRPHFRGASPHFHSPFRQWSIVILTLLNHHMADTKQILICQLVDVVWVVPLKHLVPFFACCNMIVDEVWKSVEVLTIGPVIAIWVSLPCYSIVYGDLFGPFSVLILVVTCPFRHFPRHERQSVAVTTAVVHHQ